MGDAATDAGIDAVQRRLMFEEEAKYSSTSRWRSGEKKIRISGEAVEDKDNDDGTRRDWAGGLPEGILDMITDHLSISDCASFVDVCISWSKVIKEQSQQSSFRGFPLLLTGSSQRFRYTRTCLTSLDNFSSCWGIDMPEAYMKHFWGSFHDWLILVEVKRCCSPYLSRVKLYNPFFRVTIDLPETFNSYEMLVASGRPSDPNFVCILLPYNCYGYVSFWAPGRDKWHKCLGLSCLIRLVDAVFCGWCFYLLTSDWNIYTIDVRDVFRALAGNHYSVRAQYHEIKMLVRPRTEGGVWTYLVESQGEVLLVCRVFDQETFGTKKFIIYKLDVCEMAWKKVENLGDRVLFLGKCCSRSFSALHLGIQKANCIYFTGDWRLSLVDRWDLSQFQRNGSGSVIEGLEENSDWGIFSFNPEDLGHFTFPCTKKNYSPIWLTAPLSSYCRGGKVYKITCILVIEPMVLMNFCEMACSHNRSNLTSVAETSFVLYWNLDVCVTSQSLMLSSWGLVLVIFSYFCLAFFVVGPPWENHGKAICCSLFLGVITWFTCSGSHNSFYISTRLKYGQYECFLILFLLLWFSHLLYRYNG